MENNNLSEIVRNMFTGKSRELSMEELDNVVGGVMTNEEVTLLRNGLKLAKILGYSMDDVLGYIPEYYDMYHDAHPNVTAKEVEEYIKDNWKSL